VGAVVLGCLGAGGASAQDAPALRTHRLVLDGGVVWSGGYVIGDVAAQLRSNAPGSTPPPFTLLSARSDVSRVSSVKVRLGFTVTPRVTIEAGGSFGTPRLGADISSDVEAGRQRIDGEVVKQFQVDAALLWHLPIRFGARARPFLTGGAGYLRQLHEERTLVEAGQVFFGGVGARYWIRGGAGSARSLGLRTDLCANVRRGGIDFEDRVRVFPTLGVHLFLGL